MRLNQIVWNRTEVCIIAEKKKIGNILRELASWAPSPQTHSFLFCCVRATEPNATKVGSNYVDLSQYLNYKISWLHINGGRKEKWFQGTCTKSANLHSFLFLCYKRQCIKCYLNSALGPWPFHRTQKADSVNESGGSNACQPHWVSYNSCHYSWGQNLQLLVY